MDESGTKYKVSNWSEYNKSLVNRGKVTLWVPDDIHEHWQAKASSKPGRPATYSDVQVFSNLNIIYEKQAVLPWKCPSRTAFKLPLH